MKPFRFKGFLQRTIKTDISIKSKNAAKRRYQITTQRSGCDLERMSSGVSAL
ncbi:toxin-antitoxin system, toxin component, RelE domain protein [Clostridium sp. ATCC BAA-442]|nr:toxin-antitoxin system, toxin component, RelE domain protein [Clostridium sp. ATCC BAA-442]